MNWGKIFRRTLSALVIVLIVLCNAVTHAEVQTYEGYGEYFLDEDETVDLGKEQAALRAERDALEQVKIYVQSHSRAANARLLEDEVIVIVAGILRVIETKHVIAVQDDALIVKAFVKATIDTDELEKLLDNAVKNR